MESGMIEQFMEESKRQVVDSCAARRGPTIVVHVEEVASAKPEWLECKSRKQ